MADREPVLGRYEPLTIFEYRQFKEDCERIGDTGWACVPESVWRLLATIDHLLDHLPDQKHNEQAIRTLQAQNHQLQGLLSRAHSILSLGERNEASRETTADETWMEWWRETEMVLRADEH